MQMSLKPRRLGFDGPGRRSCRKTQGICRLQINDKVLAAARPGAMVLHCLPAHREEEITTKVFEAHANEIFDEAENRLHAQKAVLVKLMGPEEV